MKRFIAKLYIVFMLLLVSAPLTAMAFHAQMEPIGNETEVELPLIATEDGKWNLNYFPELGEWFESHFAFRAELISLNSWLRDTFFQSSTSDSVIAGSDGWLYYAATLDDYQHNNNVSERTLFNEAHNVALYQEAVESSGSTFLFTIAPNKNTLYGSHMPQTDKIYNARHSDFERLVPYLEAQGVNYVDVVDLFDSDNEENPLYYKRDSHWTETGAVLVYNRLLDIAGVDHETYDDVTPTAVTDYYGDLANMLYPDSSVIEPETRLVYLENPSWVYTSETSSVEENFITTQNANASGTLLMYRDSFGNSLLPYMAEAFGTGVFSKNEPLNGNDLTTYSPDVVIYEKVERHLPSLSSVPAMITGPVRYETLDIIDTVIDADYLSGTTCTQSQTSGYITISGVAAGDAVKDETRFYVAVTDAATTTVYEAYTVNTSSADGNGDYGYLLYLDSTAVTSEISNIRILAVNTTATGAEEMTAIYDQVETPAAIAEAEAEAAAQRQSEIDAVTLIPDLEDSEDADAVSTEEAEAPEDDKEDAAEASSKKDKDDKDVKKDEESADAATTEETESTDTASTADTSSSSSGSQSTGNSGSSGGYTAPATTAPATTTAPVTTTTPDPAPVETTPAVPETPITDPNAGVDTGAATTTPDPSTTVTPDTGATTTDPAATTTPTTPDTTTPTVPYEVSRVYIEDCGYDSGYWDITYSDGSHQYIDVP